MYRCCRYVKKMAASKSAIAAKLNALMKGQSHRKMKEVFSQLDHDSSGALDRVEIQNFFSLFKVPTSLVNVFEMVIGCVVWMQR